MLSRKLATWEGWDDLRKRCLDRDFLLDTEGYVFLPSTILVRWPTVSNFATRLEWTPPFFADNSREALPALPPNPEVLRQHRRNVS